MTSPKSKEVEVMAAQRRRRWTAAEKLAMVRETYEPGQSVSLVARKHGVNPNQIFHWRKLERDGALTAVGAGETVVPATELDAAHRQITRRGGPADAGGRRDAVVPEIDMKAFTQEHILEFVRFQQRLALAFKQRFPVALDFDLLLDFPKSGEVDFDNESWSFKKHGRGLRFERIAPAPRCVVDIHVALQDPHRVDDWRLIQFAESTGKTTTKEEIAALLERMVGDGCLERIDRTSFRLRS